LIAGVHINLHIGVLPENSGTQQRVFCLWLEYFWSYYCVG